MSQNYNNVFIFCQLAPSPFPLLVVASSWQGTVPMVTKGQTFKVFLSEFNRFTYDHLHLIIIPNLRRNKEKRKKSNKLITDTEVCV